MLGRLLVGAVGRQRMPGRGPRIALRKATPPRGPIRKILTTRAPARRAVRTWVGVAAPARRRSPRSVARAITAGSTIGDMAKLPPASSTRRTSSGSDGAGFRDGVGLAGERLDRVEGSGRHDVVEDPDAAPERGEGSLPGEVGVVETVARADDFPPEKILNVRSWGAPA